MSGTDAVCMCTEIHKVSCAHSVNKRQLYGTRKARVLLELDRFNLNAYVIIAVTMFKRDEQSAANIIPNN